MFGALEGCTVVRSQPEWDSVGKSRSAVVAYVKTDLKIHAACM